MIVHTGIFVLMGKLGCSLEGKCTGVIIDLSGEQRSGRLVWNNKGGGEVYQFVGPAFPPEDCMYSTRSIYIIMLMSTLIMHGE
jgi:hypothetical protein